MTDKEREHYENLANYYNSKKEILFWLKEAETDLLLINNTFRTDKERLAIQSAIEELNKKEPIRCENCGYYEKCTNHCSLHHDAKVFRQPYWFCASAIPKDRS